MPTPSLLQRLKERKLVQWALAYFAGAWVVLQALDALETPLGLTATIQRAVLVVLIAGFFVALVLAWYHGEKGRQRVSGPELLMVAALLVVAGVALSTLAGREEASRRGEKVLVPIIEDDRPSIAVLPLDNFSPDPNHAYFADGVHEEIISKLSKVSALRVISRNSVEQYREERKPTRQVAAELGVGFILEGSARIGGGIVRLTLQLIDGNTDTHLWSEEYDRRHTVEDFISTQSEIAQEVALALQVEITQDERDRISTVPTENPEAHLLYLQSLEYYSLRPRAQNLPVAQTLLEEATTLDPTFALAFAQLSLVVGVKWRLAIGRSPADRPAQRTAADSALALQPNLPEAHQAAAYVHLNHDEFQQALDEFAIALGGAPNDPRTFRWIAAAHRRLGNWPEAIAAFERASQLDPRNAEMFRDLGGQTFEVTHRYREAAEAYNWALRLEPDFASAAWRKGWAYCSLEDQLDTLRLMVNETPGMTAWNLWHLKMLERDGEGALAVFPTGPDRVDELQIRVETNSLYSGWMHQVRGDERAAQAAFDSARVLMEDWEDEHPGDPRIHGGLGYAYAGLGRVPEAAQRAELQWEAYRGDALDELSATSHAARILATAGLADEAIELLGRQLAGPSTLHFCDLKYDWRFDPIRFHPRFQALLERQRDDVEY